MPYLTFDLINGGSVELNGFLNRERRSTTYDIVHGTSSDGTLITLQDCFETLKRGSLSQMTTSSIHVGVIFAGQQFNSSDDIKFASIDLQYSYLDDCMKGADPKTNRVQVKEDYFLVIQHNTLNHERRQLGDANIGMQQYPSWSKSDQTKNDHFMIMRILKIRFRDFLALAVSVSVQTLRLERTSTNAKR